MRFTCQCLNIEVDANVTELSPDDNDRLNLALCNDDFFKLSLLYGQHTNVLDFISPIRDSLDKRRSRRKHLGDAVEHRCYAIIPEFVRLHGDTYTEWMVLECFLCHSRLFAVTVRPGINASSPLDVLLSRAEVIVQPEEQDRRELLPSTNVWQLYLDAVAPWTSTTSSYEFSYHVKEHENTKAAIKEVLGYVDDCVTRNGDVDQSEKDRLVEMLTTKYVVLATDTRNSPDNYNIHKRLSMDQKKRLRSQTTPVPHKTAELEQFDPLGMDEDFDARSGDDADRNSSNSDNEEEDFEEGEEAVEDSGDEYPGFGMDFPRPKAHSMATSAPINAPMMRRGRTDTRPRTYLPPTTEFLQEMTAEEQLYAVEKANYLSRSANELTVGIFGVDGPPQLRELKDSAANSRRLLNARVQAQLCGEDPDAVCSGDATTVHATEPTTIVLPSDSFQLSFEDSFQGNGDSA